MTELNGCKPRPIKVLGPYTFSIGDTRSFSKYVSGGNVTQVKMPKYVNFKPLEESFKNPEFLVTDFAKFDAPNQLHVGFAALHQFKEQHGRLPKPWCNDDASKFLEIAKLIVKENICGDPEMELDVELLSTFCKVSILQLLYYDAAFVSK